MKKIAIGLLFVCLLAGCARPGEVSMGSEMSEVSTSSRASMASEASEVSAGSQASEVSQTSEVSEVSNVSELSSITIQPEVSEPSPVSEAVSAVMPGDTVIIENAIVFSRNETLAKAVTDTGRVVCIRQPDDWLIPGCEFEDNLARCESDGVFYVLNHVNSITLPSQNPLAATREEAPGVFCRFFFASRLYSGRWNALSDFYIKNITVLDGGNEHLIRFRVQYTITPARYAGAYSWYDPFFHKYGSRKPSEEMTEEVTLIGTDGLWMPVRDTLPRNNESYYSDRKPYSDYLYVNGLLNIVYETEDYTYFSEIHLVVDKNGKCEEAKTMTTVFAYRHSDNKVIPLIVDIEDTNVWFIDWVGNKVVFGSTWLPPASEPDSGPIFVIDESTLQYQEIVCKDTYAVCDRGFYYAGKYDNDFGAALYFYDYATGKITAYPEAEVYYIDDDNYMDIDYRFCYYQGQVIWNKGPEWFTLDQTTGKVTEYVWK